MNLGNKFEKVMLKPSTHIEIKYKIFFFFFFFYLLFGFGPKSFSHAQQCNYTIF